MGRLTLTLNIMNRFTFGKHKGKLISNVCITDPSYIKWAISKNLITLPKHLKL